MCGIVGIAGDLENKDEATMKQLLVLDYFRGPDSTGFGAVRNNRDIHVAKLANNPFDLFEMVKFRTALSGWNSRVFLGHNRLATKGAITDYNTHPFLEGHVLGVHNGTIDHMALRRLEDKLEEEFSVDSQALIAGISRLGLKKTIEMLTGSWSIVYYNADDDTINFLRNQERPMWYAYTADFKKLIWASEWWMIETAARLSRGYELYKEEKEGFRYFQTEENTHYKWSLEELRKGSDKRPKPKVSTIKGKEPPPVETNIDPFSRRRESEASRSGTTTRTGGNTSRTSLSSNDRVRHVVGKPSKPFGGFVTEEEFVGMTKHGCAWCGREVKFGDVGQTVIEKSEAVLCSTCSVDPHGNRVYTKIDYYLDRSKLGILEA